MNIIKHNRTLLAQISDMIAQHGAGLVTDHELLRGFAQVGSQAVEPVRGVDPATGLRYLGRKIVEAL